MIDSAFYLYFIGVGTMGRNCISIRMIFITFNDHPGEVIFRLAFDDLAEDPDGSNDV